MTTTSSSATAKYRPQLTAREVELISLALDYYHTHMLGEEAPGEFTGPLGKLKTKMAVYQLKISGDLAQPAYKVTETHAAKTEVAGYLESRNKAAWEILPDLARDSAIETLKDQGAELESWEKEYVNSKLMQALNS